MGMTVILRLMVNDLHVVEEIGSEVDGKGWSWNEQERIKR